MRFLFFVSFSFLSSKILVDEAPIAIITAPDKNRRALDTKKLAKTRIRPIPAAPTATPIPATSTPIAPTPTATPVPATATPISPNLKDIVYSGDRRLDVYLPDREDRPLPTVLVLHGGGNTKASLGWLAEDLSASGYSAVVPTWSLNLKAADDALCALAWLHANAETYGFDPERVAVFGHSFGGNLGVLLAAIDQPAEFLQRCSYDLPQSGAVQGAISYAGSFLMPEWFLTQGKDRAEAAMEGIFLIPRETAQGMLQALLDTPFERWLDIKDFGVSATHLIHTFPTGWIDGSEPPILLIHGASDTVVDPLESEAFAALLEAQGVEVQLLIIPSARHSLSLSSPGFDETWKATQAFLAQVLK